MLDPCGTPDVAKKGLERYPLYETYKISIFVLIKNDLLCQKASQNPQYNINLAFIINMI